MKTTKQLEEMYNTILNVVLVNREELELVICINGFSEKTMNDIVNARMGYQTLEEYLKYFNTNINN